MRKIGYYMKSHIWEKTCNKGWKANKERIRPYHVCCIIQRTQEMEKSVYNSPMVPANSEILLDSEVSSNESQSHDVQLPRSAGKG